MPREFRKLQNNLQHLHSDKSLIVWILSFSSTVHNSLPCRGRKWRRRLNGPALVFWDNGGFRDCDWQSLQNMYDSGKKHSPSQVGKYGMGSRSLFHIGDMIQIVSGSCYAVLDPDNRLEGNFGEQTNFVEKVFDRKSLAEAFPDECSPFVGLFGCTMKAPFEGTLIRAACLPWWAYLMRSCQQLQVASRKHGTADEKGCRKPKITGSPDRCGDCCCCHPSRDRVVIK